MKPSELRIGNYVLSDEGVLCEIAKIETSEFTQWDSGESYSIIGLVVGSKCNYINHYNDKSWNPVPLTEEWLLKFGFTKKRTSIFHIGKLTLILPNPQDELFPKGRVYFKFWAMKDECVLYVHQLQNLHFALTGEELEIKEQGVQ